MSWCITQRRNKMKKKYNSFGQEMDLDNPVFKVYVLILDAIDQPIDYSFGGVYSSEELATKQALKMNGDWCITECTINTPPTNNINQAKAYLEEFGYKVEK